MIFTVVIIFGSMQYVLTCHNCQYQYQFRIKTLKVYRMDINTPPIVSYWGTNSLAPDVTWLEYCCYGLKPQTINQSINQPIQFCRNQWLLWICLWIKMLAYMLSWKSVKNSSSIPLFLLESVFILGDPSQLAIKNGGPCHSMYGTRSPPPTMFNGF